jgi:tetratricopeptide (TPR) repeat protein
MLFVSLLAYLISLFFNFSVVVTNIYFWTLIAILVSFDYKEQLKEGLTIKKFQPVCLAIVLPIAILVFLGINREIKNLMTDYYFSEAKKFFYQDEIPASVLTFSYLDEKQPVYDNYKYQFIGLVFDNYNDFKDESSKYIAKQQIKKYLSELDDVKGESFDYALTQAQALTLMENFSEADIYFSKLQQKSPYYPNVYFKLAEAEEYQSNFNEAQKYYNQVLELLPDENLVNSDINLRALQNYKKLVEMKLKKIESR